SNRMHIKLGYGRGSLSLNYDEARFGLLEAAKRDEHALTDVEIGAAIDAPIESPRLEEIVAAGESVLIVVSDATRQSASAQVVNLLVRRLIELGVSPRDISIIFATGLHRPVKLEEKRELLTPFIVQRIRTLDHDASASSNFAQLGTTERGTPIELNRALTEHTHVILTGGIGFHYFAGFTGGRKSVSPGLASVRTIEATHMLALDFERGGRRAGVGLGLLEGNAVHEECEEVAAKVAPSFLINAVTDERGRAVHVYAGDWRAAHRKGCAEYAESHSLKIAERREVVIASCGGAPFDINLIQAHKTLEMASYACADGGTIILAAQCTDGTGRADFLKWFTAENSGALASRLREHYEVNGQTAWSLLLKAERFRVLLISELDDEDVRLMRMTPVRTLDEAFAQVDARAYGYIMPRGASLLPVVR
ncbi:MAG: nickel-dependent lactate racemase, partial [Pyrinomonadaceae bacterium]|nr:nickel-dependent lactate racemase [Pyrinomonadaceae bacterium]